MKSLILVHRYSFKTPWQIYTPLSSADAFELHELGPSVLHVEMGYQIRRKPKALYLDWKAASEAMGDVQPRKTMPQVLKCV